MRMYVHGAGRTGKAAWPAMAEGLFPAYDIAAPAADQIATLAGDVDVVIAHSWGAIATLNALEAGVLTARHVVLIEPALYDVARGSDAVERHIDAVTKARANLAEGDLFGFWAETKPIFFGGAAAERSSWDAEQETAEQFASMPPPWGHEITLPNLPTLVVTGGWNNEYEDIAAALASRGADHHVVVGSRHRPQDHDDFPALVDDFLRPPPSESS